ncbi:MAG TPA: hypothetical protein VFB80_10725 [Pirellulaceae bacterium]|nr:hypothetical protein [Pirellulaceae bacterium]
MIPRWSLKTLVFALPVLVVAFGVLMGASQLAAALEDAGGARLLLRLAIAGLILLAIDAVLLLAVLGLRAIDADERGEGE